MNSTTTRQIPAALFALLLPALTCADTLQIAVASNFADALRDIAGRFQQDTGHEVRISVGSSGRHFAQIRNGAPFDLFFSADEKRPRLLEAAGIGVPGSRFTYATGRLVLWSPRAEPVDRPVQALSRNDSTRLAIANPRLAPYGLAAKQTLQHLGLWDSWQGRLVRGENIAQTYHFVHSGNAALGLVALSQVERPGHVPAGSRWLVPENYHQPIRQQAIQLKESDSAARFLRFVASTPVRKLIAQYGYGTGTK